MRTELPRAAGNRVNTRAHSGDSASAESSCLCRGSPQSPGALTHPVIVEALSGIRHDLVAPHDPARARLARKQFEVRAGIEARGAAIDLVRLGAVLQRWGNHDLMHILGEAPGRSTRREQADLGVRSRVIAPAHVQTIAVECDGAGAFRRLHPNEADGLVAKAARRDDLERSWVLGPEAHSNSTQSGAASRPISGAKALMRSSGHVS